jgi:hypothetical protein
VKYIVAFEKRTRTDGQESPIDPTVELDGELPDGVVAAKVFVERLESQAEHSQELLDEDDAFLGMASGEIWEYDVVDGRADEFEDAVRNSKVVFECNVIDEAATPAEDVTAVALDDGDPSQDEDSLRSNRSKPDVNADDGPAGLPTGDPSAGTTAVRHGALDDNTAEGVGAPGSELEELTVTGADDPRLGLTDGQTPGDDWAANTGPSRLRTQGVETRDLTNRSSSLKPQESGEAPTPPQKKGPASKKAANPNPKRTKSSR